MKVAIVKRKMHNVGGANYITLSFIEALKEHDITLICSTKPNFKKIKENFKIDIDFDIDIKQPSIPKFFNKIDMNEQKCGLLASGLLKSYVRKNKDDYDLIISLENEANFGKPSIQYVYYPDYYNMNSFPFLKSLGYDKEQISKNLTMAVSDWSKDMYDKVYENEAISMPPPVMNDFIDVPWEERENGFVCIGYVNFAKRQHVIIRMVEMLRNKGHNVHLHIIGEPVMDYGKEVKKLADKRHYIHFEGRVSRERLVDIVSHHKYGIHARINEHYGIAPAEMVNAGCIVFAHNSAGQRDILLKDNNLLFDVSFEGVEKIDYVLRNSQLQKDLRKKLSKSKPNSPKEFKKKISKSIDWFVKNYELDKN